MTNMGTPLTIASDTLFTMFFRQMLARKEELLVNQQIEICDDFLCFEKGVANLLIQFGAIVIAQEIRTTFGKLVRPVAGHEISNRMPCLDQLLNQPDCGNYMAVAGQIDKQNLQFQRLLPFVQYTTYP